MDGKGNLIKGMDIDKPNDVTQTGYYLCKGIETGGALIYDAASNLSIKGTNVIVIRYAEVLLSYAEAKNEALAAPDNTVYNAINEVRTRAGLPNLPEGLSKEDMRAAIRDERCVELCFEHLYYFDCLRWKDKTRFATPKIANITYTYALTDDGTVKTDETLRKIVTSRTFTYPEYAEKRVLNLDTDFGWFFPIPQTELDKNPNIVQNGAFTGNNKQ
jgi:hypothetical protein